MNLKKAGAEAILTGIMAPLLIGFIYWFLSFVLGSYSTMADVSNIKADIIEIKQDVKDVKRILMEQRR